MLTQICLCAVPVGQSMVAGATRHILNHMCPCAVPGGQTMVAGATRVSVATAEAADALVKKAAAARAVEATAMNATSSRSHSIFMLYIQGQHAATGERLHGMLNLVDLAGRSV